ncbi:hypothetical protein [Saccharothrix texasensis]|uniref:Uncharacterized protein n=1 Tax=Saccharothrix texasensis TaxID=103734 RepID=A0A3N1H874_9PSEU|nr:hypothetical protein [Saccharothrix texasensis]ROP38735.1 hypothetical protein EDD40_4099 [Saccharothrix texasensis]
MADTDVFRTFCHISEYGETGYEHLHRMIATSAPLVLWSPSSRLLESPRCRVTDADFVRHVEQGRIRIVGREPWLLDRSFRDGHQWSGAGWRTEVDDAVRSIARDDASRPLAERRVVVAPDEQGSVRATEHVELHPEVVDTLHAALTGPTSGSFPVGVVEHAGRFRDSPRDLATDVLRHAYNHLDALTLSGGEAPFYLSPRESRFHDLLSTLHGDAPRATPDLPDQALLTDLTEQVLDLLGRLEAAGRAPLTGFAEGEGRDLLARWLSGVCATVRSGAATEGVLLRTLQADFDAGRLRNDWRDLVRGPDGVLTGGGLGLVAAEAMAQQVDVFVGLGMATGAISVARGLLQHLGHVAAPYENASQWPFLYAFGKRASGRRRAALAQVLDLLA